MTRFAPTATLLAVAVLGGAMFVANITTDPTARPVAAGPAATAGPAVPPAAPGPGPTQTSPTQISLADIPVAGADVGIPAAGTPGAAAPASAPVEISLADVPVAGTAGAPTPGTRAAGTRAAGTRAAGTYAGWTEQRELSVAVGVKDGAAVAYVCDNNGIEAWLTGTAAGGTLSLTSRSGRSVLTGRAEAGTVAVDGRDYPYSTTSTTVADAAGAGRPDVGEVAQRVGLTG